MKKALCGQCSSGWVPDTPKTFDRKCRGCMKKLASGLRTGKEPLPPKRGGWAVKKPHMSPERFKTVLTGMKKQRSGKLTSVR
jgi:hypothetical protein